MDNFGISFDQGLEMQDSIKSQNQKINIILSDFLEAAEEKLRPDYLKKIRDFLDSSDSWYGMAVAKIKDTFNKSNGDTSELDSEQSIRLMSIYILAEQNYERTAYGLLFRVAFDTEHGRSMKMFGDNYEIFEYGLGDVAFF